MQPCLPPLSEACLKGPLRPSRPEHAVWEASASILVTGRKLALGRAGWGVRGAGHGRPETVRSCLGAEEAGRKI